MGLGEGYPGESSQKGGSAGPSHHGSLQTCYHGCTAATANAIWLSEVGISVKELTVCFALIWPGTSSCTQN